MQECTLFLFQMCNNHTICQSIKSVNLYEALLVHNFSINLFQLYYSQFGIVFLLFHYKFIHRKQSITEKNKIFQFQAPDRFLV